MNCNILTFDIDNSNDLFRISCDYKISCFTAFVSTKKESTKNIRVGVLNFDDVDVNF